MFQVVQKLQIRGRIIFSISVMRRGRFLQILCMPAPPYQCLVVLLRTRALVPDIVTGVVTHKVKNRICLGFRFEGLLKSFLGISIRPELTCLISVMPEAFRINVQQNDFKIHLSLRDTSPFDFCASAFGAFRILNVNNLSAHKFVFKSSHTRFKVFTNCLSGYFTKVVIVQGNLNCIEPTHEHGTRSWKRRLLTENKIYGWDPLSRTQAKRELCFSIKSQFHMTSYEKKT